MLIEQTSNVDSSTIKNVIYNFPSKSLKVTFVSGAVYEYADVDKEVYEGLCEADSQGKFFSEKIKNNFQYTKLLKS